MNAVDKRHAIADHVRHRFEQVPRLHHDLNGLIRVAEKRDPGLAGHRLLAALEGPGLELRLERRDHLLGHLLEVGDLVEGDHVPDRDHSLELAVHVPEQIGNR